MGWSEGRRESGAIWSRALRALSTLIAAPLEGGAGACMIRVFVPNVSV